MWLLLLEIVGRRRRGSRGVGHYKRELLICIIVLRRSNGICLGGFCTLGSGDGEN